MGGDDERPRLIAIEQEGAEFLEGVGPKTVEGLVDQKQAGASDDRTGQDEACALEVRERPAAQQQRGIQALRQSQHIVQKSHGSKRPANFVEADVSPAESDVLGDGGIQDVVATEDGDVMTEGWERPLAQVEAVDQDVPCRRRTQAVEQVEQRAGSTAETATATTDTADSTAKASDYLCEESERARTGGC
jgi:hypothetical protein